MASRTLDVELRAKDGLSAVFRKAGDSSRTLGETLEKIGPEGKRSFDMLEQGVSTVTVSMKTLERQAGSFGDLMRDVPTLTDQIESMADGTEKLTVSVTEGADALASIFGGGSTYVDSAESRVTALGDAAEATGARLALLADSGNAATTTFAELVAQANEAERAFIADGMALAGLDDALSQINLTSMATETSRFAENVGLANTALENTTRIILGNTDAMKQKAEGALTWATELINVWGELGRIDELLAGGLIDQGQYDAAQNAYDSIAAPTALVVANLHAVQAIQASLIAQLTADQAVYVAQLRQLPAEQQLNALGWMDINTAAEANQAIMLASDTAGEYGEAGYQMTQ